jgi:hypothetical protein
MVFFFSSVHFLDFLLVRNILQRHSLLPFQDTLQLFAIRSFLSTRLYFLKRTALNQFDTLNIRPLLFFLFLILLLLQLFAAEDV